MNRIQTAQTTSTYATSPQHCWGESYVYDNQLGGGGAWGNLTNINAASSAYNGCTQENLSVVATTNNQISGYCYDAAGNLLAQGPCPAGPPYPYAYDAENRLTATGGVGYTYDGDGRRVQKSNGTLYWYGPGGEVLDETDLAGNLTNEYVHFGGKRVARRDSAGNVFYYFEDHLGTSRVITTATGVVCYDADFYPFGGERAYTDACAQNYKFTGKERDAESNLDNFGARYFFSQMGRFQSADPLVSVGGDLGDPSDPQSWNAYAYGRNNPLGFVDPDGMLYCHYDLQDPGSKHNRLDCVTDQEYRKHPDKYEGYKHYFSNLDQPETRHRQPPSNNSDAPSPLLLAVAQGTQMSRPIVEPAFWATMAFLGMFGPGILEGSLALPGAGLTIPGGGLVIGKMGDLGDLGPGERTLDLPNMGSPKANWAQNSSKLREAMSEGNPIRDASAGKPGSNTGFLRAERNVLENHGWTLKDGYWYPPSK